jgi:hypothetical protein
VGGLVRTYAYGTGLLSECQFSGGAWKTSYYAFDGHGSARFLSDATGTVTDTSGTATTVTTQPRSRISLMTDNELY